jgi:hypothetical protein
VIAESSGEYIALVVRLQANADGDWYVSVDGTTILDALPLRPLSLVVRLWRATNTGILRGNIRLLESDQWVPIQSNAQLEQLVQAWLLCDPGLSQDEGGAPAAGQ